MVVLSYSVAIMPTFVAIQLVEINLITGRRKSTGVLFMN